LGVVGFDDIPESTYCSPPLTIISQDYHVLGRMAIQKLVELIESCGKTDVSFSERVIIRLHLLVRKSTNLRSRIH
jgi:DNA-binding LacI/PurR family transcriptional regulator